MASLEELEKRIRKRRRQSRLTESDRRLIAVISAIIVLICIGIAFFIAMQPKTVITQTEHFTITEEGNNSEKITITIEGEVPSGYKLSIDISENSYFSFNEITSEKDKAEHKTVYELTPLDRGTANLDFYYMSENETRLYSKLHYTVEVFNVHSMRLLTVNVTE